MYERGSVIPYINKDSDIFYLLAIDSAYGTLIDIGGHRELQDNNIIDTAYREFKEETLSCFPFIKLDTSNEDVSKYVQKTSNNIGTIFTIDVGKYQNKLMDGIEEYNRKISCEPYPENLSLVLISRRDIVQFPRMYFYPPLYEFMNNVC